MSRSGLWRAEAAVSLALVVVIFALTFAQVIARYAMRDPFTWTEEIARYALVALTFIGSALVMARGGHIVVDLNPEGRGRVRKFSSAVASLLTITGCLFLAYVCFLNGIEMHGVPSSATGFPLAVLYHTAGVSFLLMAYHSMRTLLRSGELEQASVRGI
jgi:TRAP-type C4-dicarboxylate transport system permease small subunit